MLGAFSRSFRERVAPQVLASSSLVVTSTDTIFMRSMAGETSSAANENNNAIDPTPKPRDELAARKTSLTTSLEDGVARRVLEGEEASSTLPPSLTPRLVAALARSQSSERMREWYRQYEARPRWTECPVPGIPPPLAAPWTRTRDLLKRKSYRKRGRFIVQCFEAEEIRRLREVEPYRSFPMDLKEGDTVEVVHTNYEMGPSARNMTWSGKVSFVRKMDSLRASFGVVANINGEKWEKTWMLYSKDLLSIKVVQKAAEKKQKLK